MRRKGGFSTGKCNSELVAYLVISALMNLFTAANHNAVEHFTNTRIWPLHMEVITNMAAGPLPELWRHQIEFVFTL